MKKCPKCGTYNDLRAMVCDCGYSFSAATASATRNFGNRFNSAGTLTKALISVAVILVVFSTIMWIGTSGNSPSRGVKEPSQGQASPPSGDRDIFTAVVRESAGAYASTGTLKQIETNLTKEAIESARVHVLAEGYPATDIAPNTYKSSSRLIEIGNNHLGVVDISSSSSALRAVFSIRGDELVRVTCINAHGSFLPSLSGTCGDKVHEVFGVIIPSAAGNER